MGKKKIKLSTKTVDRLSSTIDCRKQTGMDMEEFLKLHNNFMQSKAVEGLAPRTLEEHINNMNYFKKYLSLDRQPFEECMADINVIRGIAIAKQNGKYRGRKEIGYPEGWQEIYDKYKHREISSNHAMEKLGLKRNTFYKLIKEFKESKLCSN